MFHCISLPEFWHSSIECVTGRSRPSTLKHMMSCEMICLEIKIWHKVKALTQYRKKSLTKWYRRSLVKGSRLPLVISLIGIEQRDIIQILCFTPGTESFNDLGHIWSSSCRRSCHLIKLWKIYFYPLRLLRSTILPALCLERSPLKIINHRLFNLPRYFSSSTEVILLFN